jgi:hypothetical protein
MPPVTLPSHIDGEVLAALGVVVDVVAKHIIRARD